MMALRAFLLRLRALVLKRRLEDELSEEIRSHLEMQIEDNYRRGMSPEDARLDALRKFGGIEQVKEVYRDHRSLRFIETIFQDVRFGLRVLRRNPGFTVLAILCLTVGIGATTAAFSWIEGILLRPFPAVANQDRMVAVMGTTRGASGFDAVSWPDFQDFQKNSTLMDWFIADRIFGTTLSVGDRAERATGSVVSANYFQSLGIQLKMGRAFEPAEESGRNAHPVTVISDQVWKDRYQSDPAIVGKTQMLNGVQHTIIGVAPEGFYGTFVGYAIQFWVPASMEEAFDAGGYKLDNRGARWIEGFARLKPGVSLAQAQIELSTITQQLEHDYPATNRGRGIQLFPLARTPFNGAGTLLPTLRIALIVACLVLLIACGNVGNLLLVKSLGRRHEMTVRLAIGAGRVRLIRQLLTEGVILSITAAIGGLLVAYWCRNLVKLLFPVAPGVIVNLPAEIDWRVLALSAGICLTSTLLVGLIPAMHASKIDLTAAMKSSSGGVVGEGRKSLVRSALVLIQVSLSFVLLVGAGLMLKNLQGMQRINPGFSTSGVLTTSIDLISAGYDPKRARIFEDELIDRLQAVPGVESAVFSRVTPFTYRVYSSGSIAVDGYVVSPDEQPTVEYNEVGPGYFSTLGIPLTAGREFTRNDHETAQAVAIVNEVMASKYWHEGDPLGRRFQLNGRWLQVVGVAKNAKYRNLVEPAKPFFYVPMRQGALGVGLQIRTALPPGTIARQLTREIRALDPGLTPGEIITLGEQVERMNWTQRAGLILLGAFSGLALCLATVGIYGVMAYTVSQNTRELGLRMAIGARPLDLLQLIASRGLRLTLGGIVLGGIVALGLSRLMGDVLYAVSPRDPLTFLLAFIVMFLASSSACFFPALRATRIDPVRALKD